MTHFSNGYMQKTNESQKKGVERIVAPRDAFCQPARFTIGEIRKISGTFYNRRFQVKNRNFQPDPEMKGNAVYWRAGRVSQQKRALPSHKRPARRFSQK